MFNFRSFVKTSLYAVLISAGLAGCGGGGSAVDVLSARSFETRSIASVAPTVTSTNPVDQATNTQTSTQDAATMAVTGTVVTASFSQAMDPASISSNPPGTQSTFTLKQTIPGINVPGTVTLSDDNKDVIFTPSASALAANTQYTATVTTAARNADGIPLLMEVSWSFTTSSVPFIARAPVNLRSAGSFAILTQTGITDVYKSAVNGDVGTSPITGAALLLQCDEVVGTMYTVDAAGPPCAVNAPSKLTTAIGDMGLAYDDAAGRTLPDHTELGDGEIGGLTLTPGLYKWGTSVLISTDVYLFGGPTDVWIFQIDGTVDQASGTKVHLTGGALAKNVFWQSAGAVSVGTTAVFEGVMLAKTMVAVKTGATVNGRLLAQTAVTLQMNKVNQPAP